MTTQNKSIDIFSAADKHYAGITGMHVVARRDFRQRVQVELHLVHQACIDEHWLKKLTVRLINPGTEKTFDARVEAVLLNAAGYGSLIRTEWVYTHTGLAYFHAKRAKVEVVAPSRRVLVNDSFFHQATLLP